MQKTETNAPDSILSELKTRTARRHRATEAAVNLFAADFSLEDYLKLLVGFYGFYQSFEEKMRLAVRRLPIDLDYSQRLNAPKLLADLRSLGMSGEEISRIELFADLPALDSRAAIFGALYVVEGSTLGGQVIARHLREKFGLDETSGAAFFSGYGGETGRKWNEFRRAIGDFVETDAADRERIVESADATFEKIGRALAARSF